MQNLTSKIRNIFVPKMNDIEKKQYEDSVLKYERLMRLKENKDFQEFISNGFINDSILQAGKQLAWATEESKKDIYIQLEASALLEKYMRIIEDEGKAALEVLKDN